MTVAALPGNVRLRKFQLGKETTFGTAVTATRRFPWTYAPTVDPHWTFPTADTGTLDEAIAPYQMASDVTGSATGSLAYNDAPYLFGALTKGGITPSGGGPYVWTYTPASTSQDIFEIFTGEWGDEVAGDQFRYTSGVLDKLQLQWQQDLRPLDVTADFRFASATYPHTAAALAVDYQPAWVFAADTSLYIDSAYGSIETTKLLNSMHSATVVISNNLDVKRFSNGSNTRFQVAGYGRGKRTVEITFDFAKSTAALVEFGNWLTSYAATERFVGLNTVSPEIAGGSTAYSLDLRFPGYWFTRTEGTYATNNTTGQLKFQGIIDQSLTYPFTAIITNSLTAY